MGQAVKQRSVSAQIVETLARDWDRPIDEVQTLYEREFDRLQEFARLNDYVALFAIRRTVEILARRSR